MIATFSGNAPLWLEVWRTALIILGFIMVGQMFTLWKLRSGRGNRRKGEMPGWALVSWGLLVLYQIGSMADRYGEDLSWRSPLATFALGVGEYALLQALNSGEE